MSNEHTPEPADLTAVIAEIEKAFENSWDEEEFLHAKRVIARILRERDHANAEFALLKDENQQLRQYATATREEITPLREEVQAAIRIQEASSTATVALTKERNRLRAEKAELLTAAREFYTSGAIIMTGNEHTEDEHFRAIQARDALRSVLAKHAKPE